MLKRTNPGRNTDAGASPQKKPRRSTFGNLVSLSEPMVGCMKSNSSLADFNEDGDHCPTRPSTPSLETEIAAEARAKNAGRLHVSDDAMCGFCRGPIHIRPDAFLREHAASDQRMCTPCSWALQRTAIMSSIRGIIRNPADQLRLQQLASRQHQAHMDETAFFERLNKAKPMIKPECFNPQYLQSFPVFSPVYAPVELPPTPKISPNVLSMLSPCNVKHAPPLELTPPSSPALQSKALRRQMSTISRLCQTQSHGPSVGLFG